jgi:23S rRNA pseudouridine1911/1915/1917 synthase
VSQELPAGQHRLRVPPKLDLQRLDLVLVALLTGHSRSRLQRLVREGAVQVDGQPVDKPRTPVPAGAELLLDLPEPTGAITAAGEPIGELTVIYEDEHLAVIDKPAGQVVHPGERFQSGTVSELAVARWGPLPTIQGEDRPGIVHRLDRMTSGLMLVARTEPAMTGLMEQFRERKVEKTYIALCHGSPRFDSEWIDGPIERVPRVERLRVATEEGAGREARTFIECKERFHGFARISAQPKTGRTHQIRVHLSHLGLPIVGDRVYKTAGALAVPLPKSAPSLQRQALHAAGLAFEHPDSGEAMLFELPLPEDMGALLEWLRREMPG